MIPISEASQLLLRPAPGRQSIDLEKTMLMELKIMVVDPDLIWDVPNDLHPLVELLHPSHQKVELWNLEQDIGDKPQVQELLKKR